MSIAGLFTALVTPFHEDQSLNLDGLRENVRFQVKSGVDGLVVLGTTGEAPTLTSEERQAIVELVVEEAGGKCHICVGSGGNSTSASIEATKLAKRWGADSALIVTPYYNRPTQKGIYEHFAAVSGAVDLPIVVYNHPGRTGQIIEPMTLMKIAELPQVIGMKDCSADVTYLSEVLLHAPEGFEVVSGNDEIAFPLMSLGGVGLMSVLANLAPVIMGELVHQQSRERHFDLFPLFKGMNFEPNPIPIKAAMNFCGLPAGPCRLPLSKMGEGAESALQQLLTDAGLAPAYR